MENYNENQKQVCQNCGTEISANAVFCENCGTKLEVQEPKKHFCSQCGNELGEHAVFCEKCGAKVVTKETVVAQPVYEPVEEVVEEPKEKGPSYTFEFKKFAGSPLFLVLAILVSLTGVVGLLQFNLISFVTYILLIIGCWILWAKSRSAEGDPYGGVKLIKSAVVFNFVMGIIAVSLIALVFVILIIALGIGADFIGGLAEVNTDGLIVGIVIGGGLVVGVSFTLVILYYKSITKFLSSLMSSIKENKEQASSKAMFPAVMIFIVAVFSLINLLTSAITNAMINEIIYEFASELPDEIYNMVISLTQGSTIQTVITLLGTMVAIYGGVLMIIYKNKMSKLK